VFLLHQVVRNQIIITTVNIICKHRTTPLHPSFVSCSWRHSFETIECSLGAVQSRFRVRTVHSFVVRVLPTALTSYRPSGNTNEVGTYRDLTKSTSWFPFTIL
jgi:hypothetical protein